MPTHGEMIRDMGFGQAICAHLMDQIRYRPHGDLIPEDITDVDVRWDDGDRYDPESDVENDPPELSVRVTFRPRIDLAEKDPDRLGSLTMNVDPAFALESVMRSLLGLPHA